MASAADAVAASTTTNGPENSQETELSSNPAAAVATTTADASLAPTVESEPAAAPDALVEPEDAAPSEGDGAAAATESKKWPGWPGHSVFRMIVPVLKVGSIIGRKGELIKKLCEETRARVRILEGAIGTNDRIVLISGKEEPEAEISPAMNAVLRVFKRISGISDNESDGQPVSSVRLLVASSQAISLIGKGGALIKSIQEGSGTSVRVLPGEDLPFYAASDERIVEMQGESLKVLKALESVVGHLRKFLVDHSVIPLFEKTYSSPAAPVVQDRAVDTWADKTQSSIHATPQTGITNDYPPPLKRDLLYYDRDSRIDSQIQRSGLSLYGQDPALTGIRPSGHGRTAGALVTQITQTMQIPLSYAEDIIGIGGANIAYIRRTSGAILTVQESRGLPDEITVEIKGTSTQVQTAQQLIQDFIAGHKEPAASGYGNLDTGYMSSYSQLGSGSYPSSSSLGSQSLGGYGSSGGVGGYGSYRY